MSILTNPKKLFLIDGIGALVSAFFLGIILVVFEPVFGMPRNILYWIAAVPCIFAMYSLSCYYFLNINWRPYLKVIAIANLLYCSATIWLVYCYYRSLTCLGVGYFVVELLIIAVVISLELKASSKSHRE